MSVSCWTFVILKVCEATNLSKFLVFLFISYFITLLHFRHVEVIWHVPGAKLSIVEKFANYHTCAKSILFLSGCFCVRMCDFGAHVWLRLRKCLRVCLHARALCVHDSQPIILSISFLQLNLSSHPCLRGPKTIAPNLGRYWTVFVIDNAVLV